jgi:hypothetical protein
MEQIGVFATQSRDLGRAIIRTELGVLGNNAQENI